MPYQYAAIPHTVCIDDHIHTTYGICALYPDTGEKCAWIPDVSPDRKLVEFLAQACTDGQLDPIQLLDVVLDSLS